MKPRHLAITMGDPAGIGPELAAKVLVDPEVRAAGKQAAARHRCSNCHMDNFGGSQAAPAIAGQTRAYTAKALRDYRADARPSVGVAAMNEAAKGLSDADIAAIAVYLERPE